MDPPRSRRQAWHYWISALRLAAAVTALLSTFLLSAQQFAILNLVPWLLVIVTDILLLTVDLWRTCIFSTSFFAQLVFTTIAGLSFVAYAVLAIRSDIIWQRFVLIVIPNIFGALCSFGLVISLSLAFRNARAADSDIRWTVNGKDLLAGTVDPSARTSLFGSRRPVNLCSQVIPTRKDIANFGVIVGAYCVKLVFRRISPVESKKYAASRNFFALLAVAAIVVRAVTLLSQAQSQVFETKNRTENCQNIWDNDLKMSDIKIVVKDFDNKSSQAGSRASRIYNLELSAQNNKGYFTFCPWDSGSAFATLGTTRDTTEGFHSATCFQENNPKMPALLLKEVAFNLKLTFLNTSLGNTLRPPQVWLAHYASSTFVPWLVPSWQLIPGFHSEAETTMAKRNFIASTFMRDVIGGAKPIYETVPMFPITTTHFTPINNGSIATGAIRPALRSFFTSSTARKDIQNLQAAQTPLPITCEVVEDYRSSTAFDALGSIGGLFAILQGIHLLLFGRPLFWGIAGAKLISPFGLFGRCSSQGFRRRLREHYSLPLTQLSEDPRDLESIRITSFLKDFVVDFGPIEPQESKATGLGNSTNSCSDKHKEYGSQVELLPVFDFQSTRFGSNPATGSMEDRL